MIEPFSTATPDHWNNLVWVLASPDIAPEAPLPWLPENRRVQLARYFSLPQVKNQLEPQLLNQLQQLHNHRLGAYFECLWRFVFTHHPDYQLLAHNLPLREDGKTLGELDFVVHYLPEEKIEHWEVAVKFYLQVADSWVGPGLRDRLDIKLARTRDHQLPIIHQPKVQPLLREQGIEIQRQWTLMPGRRFSPLGSAPTHAGYWWTDWPGFLHTFAGKPWHWLQLPKQSWLSPCAPIHASPPADLTGAASEVTAKLHARGPLCVAAVDKHREVTRGFIVPDDWASRAQLTLP